MFGPDPNIAFSSIELVITLKVDDHDGLTSMKWTLKDARMFPISGWDTINKKERTITKIGKRKKTPTSLNTENK